MENQEIKILEQELIDAELNYRLGLDTNFSDEEFDRKYKRL